ncbi:cytokine SCM-1 beta-like [Marmota marmota marmota]|uniref:Lymphotactin n=1 Tax=Marmota marmota marmota TaxID=9994 RepID=A0A8C6EX32_MARMA|nr:cytokine SCM-1 beta-like [Marmota marmota marmota]
MALNLTILSLCFLSPGVGSEVPERSICVSLSTQRLPINRIRTYTIKEGSVRAVIFITKRGLKVCANPEAEWVKSAVKSMDSRSTTKRSKLQSSPTRAQPTNTAGTLSR